MEPIEKEGEFYPSLTMLTTRSEGKIALRPTLGKEILVSWRSARPKK